MSQVLEIFNLTRLSNLLVLVEEQIFALTSANQCWTMFIQTQAAPSNSSDQLTADKPLPLPSMMASSLSSFVTHPCLFVAIAVRDAL